MQKNCKKIVKKLQKNCKKVAKCAKEIFFCVKFLQIFCKFWIYTLILDHVKSLLDNSFIPLCTKVTEIPSSSSFRLEGIILLLSKTKRNRCSSSVSLSENFQKCWIGYTKKKNYFTKLIGLTRKVEEFSTSKNAQNLIIY